MKPERNSSNHFELLAELTLNPPSTEAASSNENWVPDVSPKLRDVENRVVASEETQLYSSRATELISTLKKEDLENLKSLAMTNHVIVRAFHPLHKIFEAKGNIEAAEWTDDAIQQEHSRIDNALASLDLICTALEEGGCPAMVIKSLDHWPDLGNDLDLYTHADSSAVVNIMRARFNAHVEERSWGDRLANKWNFSIPGLTEPVEVHIGRLGQTGEQIALTRSLTGRARNLTFGQRSFRVAAPEDRIVISTLQRMYRHFYMRLCDVMDNAQLVESGVVDFPYLRELGLRAGLWEGIATYLAIVSELVESYRGHGLLLPAFVPQAARFGSEQVSFRRDFLRVSIVPHSVHLYAAEFKKLLLDGDLKNSFRLSLLPCLATAAAIGQKVTGSDKGIW
ncbi:MAG TPA: nucleotidyltransferase family protein [Candidatus Solibacter sp.]|nr:nucleotidyltransferase family protein [Candidatus Solibacter sp.]